MDNPIYLKANTVTISSMVYVKYSYHFKGYPIFEQASQWVHDSKLHVNYLR